MFTPLQINMLIHYHISPDQYELVKDNGVRNCQANQLVECGLLKKTSDGFDITQRGSFYVTEGLCKVPLPVSKFHIPWGDDK